MYTMYAAPRRRSRRSGGGRQPKPWRGGRALPLATLRRRCTIACLTTVRLRTRVCVYFCVRVCPRATAAAVHRTAVAVRRQGAASGPTRASHISVVRNYIIFAPDVLLSSYYTEREIIPTATPHPLQPTPKRDRGGHTRRCSLGFFFFF